MSTLTWDAALDPVSPYEVRVCRAIRSDGKVCPRLTLAGNVRCRLHGGTSR